MPRSIPSPVRVAAAALVALAVLAGCGGGSGDSDNAGDEPSTTASSTGEDDFAALSGEEISELAKEDMLALESVAYAGQLVSNGSPLGLDVQASSDGRCTGTVELSGGTVEVLAADGGAWYRPDAAFWRANAGADADAIITAVGDKWVVDTADDFSQFCDLDGFLNSLFQDDGESTYEKVGTEEVDGQEVVLVTSTDDDGSATGYVLVEGEHYLVKIERTEGDNPGELSFSAFDEEVSAEAPAEDEQIDHDQQAQG